MALKNSANRKTFFSDKGPNCNKMRLGENDQKVKRMLKVNANNKFSCGSIFMVGCHRAQYLAHSSLIF